MTQPKLNTVLRAIDSNAEEDLDDLFTLVRQPSISAQNVGVRETAMLVREYMESAGLSTRMLETSGHPMVLGASLEAGPDKPTILFYGHYDVQPPDPLELWESEPFEPDVRNGRIYARGVADNKAQFMSHVMAIRHWMREAGELPVNVKFLAEGEEEVGSPHLDEIVAEYADVLSADLVYTSDGPVQDTAYPEICFGVRGMLYIELRATGPSRDVHSGHWGGVAPNPAWMLVDALRTMRHTDGTITIDGFFDEVKEPTPAARAAMDDLPFDTAEMLARVGLEEMVPPADLPWADRIMARPTLNIAGFTSGYGGPGSKTIIPSKATVKIDMRLVPDQTPDEIWEKVKRHVERHAPGVEVVRLDGGMVPSYTPVEHPMAEVVRRAVERGFGTRPVDVPLVGGSLPDAVWTKTLGIPSFLVPYGDPEQANHAPNESYAVDRYRQGIRTSAILLAELAKRS
jgi:acetylornithine deacetylase/succinyl-diaminopimelate desuccinylase-like protein